MELVNITGMLELTFTIKYLILRVVALMQFMMANGALVRVLIHTDVTKYLYFKAVDGSYVYNKGKVRELVCLCMISY